MYRTCISCGAGLGANELLESFPVGSTVAFDAVRGRLWAVCPSCRRWNLAPIEERWEPVEAAERAFRDTPTRVQAENIGLARLPDGTRLVRVGGALEGELAAWRYGGELYRRRRAWMWAVGGGVATGAAALALLPAALAAGVGVGAVNLVANGAQVAAAMHQRRWRKRVVHRIAPADSPTGSELLLRRYHLFDATLDEENGAPLLRVADVSEERGYSWEDPLPGTGVTIGGEAAGRLLRRAMMDYNARGATPADVAHALRLIADAGGAGAYAGQVAARGVVVARASRHKRPPMRRYTTRQILGTFRGEILPVQRYRSPFDDGRPRLETTEALALEMALHDEGERRALEGELRVLEADWREAEEIAAIADALPGGLETRLAALRARLLPGR